MKTLFVLVLTATAAIFGLKVHADGREADRKREAIAQHVVTLAMTKTDVLLSRGAPVVKEPQRNGTEIWGYGDGLLVTFSKDRVIDAAKHELPAARRGAASPPAAVPAGSHYEWSPASRKYVPVGNGTSWRRSVGGG
ncbi:MAG: hypothetical protein ABMA13_23475 [Chthoniobacteraceae bacterium]